MTGRADKLAALRAAANKKYGAGTIELAGRQRPMPGARLTTGSLSFDYAMGGGLPVGHITIFRGSESSGKTTAATRIAGMAQEVCANCYRRPPGGVSTNEHIDQETGEVWREAVAECDCVRAGLYVPRQSEGEDVATFKARLKRYQDNSYEEFRVAYLDVEGTFDDGWAMRLGCDPGRLLKVRPSTAEEAIDLHDEIVRTGSIDLLVLDSLAAMTPSTEVEASAMEWQQGLQARLLNKMSRKAQASRTAVRSDFARPITEIWVNQEREKIGVCFDYKTLITLADGSCEKIGKIVNGRIPVDVLTMSPDGCVVPRRVVQWHKGKYSGDGLYVSMGGGIGKPHGVRVTSNHMFFTPGGTVRASELKPGDIVLSCERKFFSPDQHQVILGSVLGDGSLRFERGYRGHLRVWHGKDQREYCSWKAGILGSEMHDGKRACWFETARSVEFAPYADISKCKSVRSISDSLIEQIGPLALAIWFMDDGTFEGKNRTRKWGHGRYSIFAKTLSVEILNRIAGQLEAIGAGKAHVSRGRLTWTGGRESAEFARTIAPFIHASMAYKIRHGTEIGNGSISVGIPGWCIYPNRIVAVRPVRGRGNARDCWSTGMRFDIGVDGNHNYFAGGMLVHNSYGDNTVIPGGRGQQFTASVIVKLWASQWERATVDEDMKKEWQMEGGTDVRLNFKVIKNKTARAMVQGSYRMGVSGDGAGLVLDLDYMAAQAEKFGLMRKDGAKWLLGDETYKTKGDLMARMEEAAVRRALRDRLVQLMLAAA